MDEKLTYVRMKNGDKKRIYRVVDDKIVGGVKWLVLMIVDGEGVGHYLEVYPEEVEALEQPRYDRYAT